MRHICTHGGEVILRAEGNALLLSCADCGHLHSADAEGDFRRHVDARGIRGMSAPLAWADYLDSIRASKG